MKADGKGDYPDLPAAVAAAEFGATIILEEGTYKLAETLYIHYPITIIGAGIDKTIISSKGYKDTDKRKGLVRIDGNGPFNFQGITFKVEDGNTAYAVYVERGEVHFQECRFTGATFKREAESVYGSGLKLRYARGTVRNCISDENFMGAFMDEDSNIIFEENNFSRNKGNGLYFWGNSIGIARKNRCSNNGWSGIGAIGSSNTTLEENICNNNNTGIFIGWNAIGVANKNQCSGNQAGILVRDGAKVTLEENIISKNKIFGIDFEARASGTIRKNQVTESDDVGIFLNGNSHAILEENIVSQNNNAGIDYRQGSSGSARKNQVTNNKAVGILLIDKSQTILEENIISQNGSTGIEYRDDSTGTARKNQITGNQIGIMVKGQTKPVLEENVCSNNQWYGIQIYSPYAYPVLLKNTCQGNSRADVYPVDYVARPTPTPIPSPTSLPDKTILWSEDFEDGKADKWE